MVVFLYKLILTPSDGFHFTKAENSYGGGSLTGYGTGTLGTSMSVQTPQVNRLGWPLKVGSQKGYGSVNDQIIGEKTE